ncbi:hypothetical protein BDN72DRAFT_102691 [Pluteus cervinus]|uniref:Uncharacterized protein n=1 Tax=Pluteus cervinus TaxID=181527 RepID=A0ACD3B7P7_9AGAR|nr:hypothetical protein BDN72DRAFT_102691 [Pluteus cervinus]
MSKSRLRARIGDKLPTRPNGTFMNRVWVRPDLPQQKAAPAKSSSTTSSAAKLHPNPPRPRPFIKEEPVEETISDYHASPHRPYFKHSTPSSSSAYMPPSPAEARRVVIRRTNKPPLEHRLEDPDWLESSRREGRVAAEADREGRHFDDDCHVSNDSRASKRPYLQPVRARVLSNGGIELGHDRLDGGYRSDRCSSQGGGAQSADSLPSSCPTTHASWPPTINPSDSTSTMSKPLPSSSSQIPSPSQVHSKALPDYKPLFRGLIEKNAKARQADLGEPLTPALGTTHHDIDKLLTDDVYALLLEKGDEVRRALDILKPRVVEETKSPGEVSISEDKIRLEREGELFLANVFKGLLMQSEDEKEDGEVSDLSRSAQQGSSVLLRPLLNGSNHPPLPTPPMSSVSRNGTIPPATPPRSPIQHPPRWPRAYNASPSRQASRSPLRPSTTTEQETYLNSAVSHDFTPVWNATNGKGPNQSTITSNTRNLSQGNQFSTEQNTLHWKTLPQSYPIPIPLDPLFFEPQKNHPDNSDHMGPRTVHVHVLRLAVLLRRVLLHHLKDAHTLLLVLVSRHHPQEAGTWTVVHRGQ